MSISTQLGSIPLPQTGTDLRALALAAGQNVEAKVLGQVLGGATQVAIGRQVLTLQLPTPQPPGTALTLSVQQSEGQIRLAIVGVQPAPVSVAGVPDITLPATSVQLSAAALSSQGAPAAITPVAAQGGIGQSLVPTGGASPAVPQTSASEAAAIASGVITSGISQAAGASPSATLGTVAASTVPAQLPVSPGGQTIPAPAAAQMPVAGPVSQVGPVNPSQAVAPPAFLQPTSSQASGPSSAPAVSAPPAAAVAAARPAIPYAAAPVVPAVTQVLPGAMGTTGQAQPVQQAAPATQVGQHAPAPNAPPSAPAAAPTAATASPQTALNQMVHNAVLRQDSILGLTAAMTAIAGKVPMPEPIAKAIQQVLAQRLPIDAKLDGAALQQAVRTSGIFQEALLVAGNVRTAGGDLKTSLLGLQRQLLSWLGNQAPVEQVSSVPPPVRGQVPRAKANAAAPRVIPLDPHEAGKVLLDRTEAALSRLRLHQHASLPDPANRSDGMQWSLDLPVAVAGQQALLQMQIHRDADKQETRPEDRGWQVRFAINLDEAGEVGAQISLRGLATGVLLWAERQDVADMLSGHIDELREELAAIGLTPGAVIVRAGSPAPQAQAPSVSGHFLDETR